MNCPYNLIWAWRASYGTNSGKCGINFNAISAHSDEERKNYIIRNNVKKVSKLKVYSPIVADCNYSNSKRSVKAAFLSVRPLQLISAQNRPFHGLSTAVVIIYALLVVVDEGYSFARLKLNFLSFAVSNSLVIFESD